MAGYQPIPDVEKEVADAEEKEFVITDELRERYPSANDRELELLGRLEDAILWGASPRITLPRFEAEDFDEFDSPYEFLKSLVLPTMAFVWAVISALIVMAYNSPWWISIFPYYCCILLFASAFLPSRDRMVERAEALMGRVEELVESDQEGQAVEKTKTTAMGYVQKTGDLLDEVSGVMADTADAAMRLEGMLRKIDPDINIPKPTDLDSTFDRFREMVDSSVEPVWDSVYDAKKKLPSTDDLVKKVTRNVLVPTLAVSLVTEMVATWVTTEIVADRAGTNPFFSLPAFAANVTAFITGTSGAATATNLTLANVTLAAAANSTSTVVASVVSNVSSTVTDDDFTMDDTMAVTPFAADVSVIPKRPYDAIADYGPGEIELTDDGFNNITNFSNVVNGNYSDAASTTDDVDEPINLIIFAVQTYLGVILQLTLIYLATLVNVAKSWANGYVEQLETEINDRIDAVSGKTLNVVFGEQGMGWVRERLAQLVRVFDALGVSLRKVVGQAGNDGLREQAKPLPKKTATGGRTTGEEATDTATAGENETKSSSKGVDSPRKSFLRFYVRTASNVSKRIGKRSKKTYKYHEVDRGV